MHVFIAQETVYATGIQQTLGNVSLMQVIENSGGGKLVRFVLAPEALARRAGRRTSGSPQVG